MTMLDKLVLAGIGMQFNFVEDLLKSFGSQTWTMKNGNVVSS